MAVIRRDDRGSPGTTALPGIPTLQPATFTVEQQVAFSGAGLF
jgi:hypothetical protein